MPLFPSTQIIQMNPVTNTGTTGQVWWNGTHLMMNIGGTNYQIDQQTPSLTGDVTSVGNVTTLANTANVKSIISSNVSGTYLPLAGGTISGNLQFSGTTPTLTAGPGAGTSPTKSIIGVDNGGTITLTPGLGSAGAEVILTVTYAVAFPTDSAVTISPANLSASQLFGTSGLYVNASATNFTINTTTGGLASGTQLIWNFTVVGW